MMKKLMLTFALLVLLVTPRPRMVHAADECSLDTRPKKIIIGTNYNGTTLSLSGTVPADCSAVIRMIGKRGDKHFKKKGKAFGLLWMNMGEVEMHDVPGVLLLAVDKDTYAEGGEAWKRLHLGFDSFRGETDDATFNEFLKLEDHDGLYEVQQVVAYGDPANGQRSFEAEVEVPSALSSGAYEIELFAVRDGQTVCGASRQLDAELAGFPALMSNLAYHHALLYGIMATLIAIMAGLFMSFVFKGGGGAH